VKRPVAKQQAAKQHPLKPPKAKPLALGAPAPEASSGGSSPALLIVGFGLLLAALAAGIAFMPASAVPFKVGMRLERNRQAILYSGLAIGVACVLVGILTALTGR
jgi:hypothetical protein